MGKPVIVTLQLEDDAMAFFNAQRTAYFPPRINFLDAHITLFHALPQPEAAVQLALEGFAKRDIITLEVNGLRNTGNGVAYDLFSRELQALHVKMQECFQHLLVGKDKEKLWPHITVQNKVTAFKAKTLYEKLSGGMIPFNIIGTGFSVYLYDRGPWQHISDHKFTRKAGR